MYNHRIKDYFLFSLIQKKRDPVPAQEIFIASEPFEEKADRDLCSMNEVTLNNVVSAILDTVDSSKREEYIEILREYGRWCAANRIEGFTIFLSRLENPERVSYRSRFAANPLHLKQHLDDLFPRLESPSVNEN